MIGRNPAITAISLVVTLVGARMLRAETVANPAREGSGGDCSYVLCVDSCNGNPMDACSWIYGCGISAYGVCGYSTECGGPAIACFPAL
jgi:hypothetical protein